MRIAQVAPLHESVPPRTYGGTERVVSYLTEELVRRGHDVTLFASADSRTAARLVPACPTGLRLDAQCVDPLAHHLVMLEEVYRRGDEFDVVHFHCDYLHFPLTRRHGLAHLTTLHGRLDIPDLVPLYREFREMPVASISNAQRRSLSWLRWVATVHHGLPRDLYPFRPGDGEYLAFLGRISPEKGVTRAIEIACRAGLPLRIAAKVDRVDRDYFEKQVRPLLDHPLVEFVGEIDEERKAAFLGDARALLFPIDWPEPFGMVLVEAMACGTPVVAFPGGSVEEVVESGRNGLVVRGVDDAVEAVRRIHAIPRRACRAAFEERFTAGRMAAGYEAAYERLLRVRRARRAPVVQLRTAFSPGGKEPAGDGVANGRALRREGRNGFPARSASRATPPAVLPLPITTNAPDGPDRGPGGRPLGPLVA